MVLFLVPQMICYLRRLKKGISKNNFFKAKLLWYFTKYLFPHWIRCNEFKKILDVVLYTFKSRTRALRYFYFPRCVNATEASSTLNQSRWIQANKYVHPNDWKIFPRSEIEKEEKYLRWLYPYSNILKSTCNTASM